MVHRPDFRRLPLTFEANLGQAANQVKFLARANGYTLFLTGTGAVLRPRTNLPVVGANSESSESGVVRMEFIGANRTSAVVGLEKLSARSNYFLGNDPKKWRTNVPHFARVKYSAMYPGIDVIYYVNRRQLEYDLVVQPGIDPTVIEISFSGSRNLRKDARGDLVLQAGVGEILIPRPRAYQEVGGVRETVDCGYVLKNDRRVGFQLAHYDAAQPLVIDPVLVYSTYLGGSEYELAYDVAVDSAGNAYVTGTTTSSDLPLANALQAPYAGPVPGPNPDLFGGDAFVTKIDATGSALVYSTYLGGTAADEALGIAVDAAGNACITGLTPSSDFPLTNPVQPIKKGLRDAFVAKLNASGSHLVYSTYLGGNGDENILFRLGMGIAVDASGNAYVTGSTSSTDFPTVNPIQATRRGGTCSKWSCYEYYDAFVTKLSASGSAILYSTYLGGDSHDQGNDIAVDSVGP